MCHGKFNKKKVVFLFRQKQHFWHPKWPKLRILGEKTCFFAMLWHIHTHEAILPQIHNMPAIENCQCTHHQWNGPVMTIVVPLRESNVTQYSNAVITPISNGTEWKLINVSLKTGYLNKIVSKNKLKHWEQGQNYFNMLFKWPCFTCKLLIGTLIAPESKKCFASNPIYFQGLTWGN